MIQALGRIKTEEEYRDVEERLARHISEYKSMTQKGSNLKSETEDKLRRKMEKLDGDMEKEEHKRTLEEIERLRAKLERIKAGSYEAQLRENITGLMLMKEEYEAQEAKMPFKDIIVGIAKGTPEIKEYLKKKYMLSFSNMYGITRAPESLDVEPVSNILNRMIKECNLVQISEEDIVLEKEETSLVPVEASVSGIRQALVTRIDTMVKECIGQEVGQSEVATYVENNKKDVKIDLLHDKKIVDRSEREKEGEIDR